MRDSIPTWSPKGDEIAFAEEQTAINARDRGFRSVATIVLVVALIVVYRPARFATAVDPVPGVRCE